MRLGLLVPLLALVATLLGACSGPLVTYKFPTRKYQPARYASDAASDSGLLWGETTSNVFEDARSRGLGDLVIVSIEEAADAVGGASTKTSRKSTIEGGINNFMGLVEKFAKKHPGIDTSALVKAMFSSSFEGDGDCLTRLNRAACLVWTTSVAVFASAALGDEIARARTDTSRMRTRFTCVSPSRDRELSTDRDLLAADYIGREARSATSASIPFYVLGDHFFPTFSCEGREPFAASRKDVRFRGLIHGALPHRCTVDAHHSFMLAGLGRSRQASPIP